MAILGVKLCGLCFIVGGIPLICGGLLMAKLVTLIKMHFNKKTACKQCGKVFKLNEKAQRLSQARHTNFLCLRCFHEY